MPPAVVTSRRHAIIKLVRPDESSPTISVIVPARTHEVRIMGVKLNTS
jgi:hypothetical protein